MNGAIADPSAKIIKAPNNAKKKMIGANHHFFLAFKKCQNSIIIDILDIGYLFIYNLLFSLVPVSSIISDNLFPII